MKTALLVIGLGAVLYGLKLASDAAATAQDDQLGEQLSDATGLDWLGSSIQFGAGALADANAYNPFALVINGMDQRDVDNAMNEQNVRAMLECIAWAEGTAGRPDPYRVCYGYRHTIISFAEHPALSGEWSGEPLDNLGPAYKGKKSTAAGKSQINVPTWRDARRALNLQGFTPENQDAASIWLMKRAGALDLVQQGRFSEAVARLGGVWASLPSSTAGQPIRRYADLVRVYQTAGGVIV